ncbi:MAG: hypothetical protein ABI618_07460 [Nitrospirota bacterium]
MATFGQLMTRSEYCGGGCADSGSGRINADHADRFPIGQKALRILSNCERVRYNPMAEQPAERGLLKVKELMPALPIITVDRNMSLHSVHALLA